MDKPKRRASFYVVRVGAFLGLSGLLALTILITSRKDTTNAESALWTFILFAIGVGSSYYFGKKSVSDAAADLVRTQARSASRRLKTLGMSIRTLGSMLDMHRRAAETATDTADDMVPLNQVYLAFDSVDLHTESQMRVVLDALEDWREFDTDITGGLGESGELEDSAE